MRIKPHTKSHRGFSLIELVFVLALLAVASTIMVPLAKWSVTAIGGAQQHTDMSRRFDLATSQLREDVWQAKKLTAVSPNQLTVTSFGGHSITWKIGPGDQMSRDQLEWTNLGIGTNTTVSADTNIVRLRIPPVAERAGKTVSFISETMLLTGGQP